MDEQQIPVITDALLPYFKRTVIGKYAFALAGAHAKGQADVYSDLDYFLFAEEMMPHDTIKSIFNAVADDPSDVHIWDDGIEFYYNGIKIETTVRILSRIYDVMNKCIRGEIIISPEVWTLNGYYNYVHLAEIDFLQPLNDPFNIMRGLKENLQIYPPALQNAIIHEFLWKSRFWVNNFHYISAINRVDIVYTSGIIHNIFHSIVQLLFAMNEKYYCGDKKIETQLNRLDFCPKCLTENIDILLTTKRDVEFLQKQRAILCEVNDEVDEALRRAGFDL